MTDLFNASAAAVAVALAGVLNRLVAMAVTPLFEKFKWDKTYILYVAIVLGVLTAFGFQVDLFNPPVNAVVGTLVTGILMGGGANFIHDILDGWSQRTGGGQ